MASAVSGATPLEPLDVLALALADPEDGEARIQRVFEWQLERQSPALNLGLPVVVAGLAALVSPFFAGGARLEVWQAGVLGGAILVGATVAAVAIRIRAHVLYRRYLASVELYGLLRQLL